MPEQGRIQPENDFSQRTAIAYPSKDYDILDVFAPSGEVADFQLDNFILIDSGNGQTSYKEPDFDGGDLNGAYELVEVDLDDESQALVDLFGIIGEDLYNIYVLDAEASPGPISSAMAAASNSHPNIDLFEEGSGSSEGNEKWDLDFDMNERQMRYLVAQNNMDGDCWGATRVLRDAGIIGYKPVDGEVKRKRRDEKVRKWETYARKPLEEKGYLERCDGGGSSLTSRGKLVAKILDGMDLEAAAEQLE